MWQKSGLSGYIASPPPQLWMHSVLILVTAIISFLQKLTAELAGESKYTYNITYTATSWFIFDLIAKQPTRDLLDLAQKLPSTNYDKMCVDAHKVKRIASEKQHKASSELETVCER